MQPTSYYQHIPQQKYMMQTPFVDNLGNTQGVGEEDDSDGSGIPDKRTGRRKIKIEYITDKSRRHITFSKRKAGIMKKAYELSTLTGTQVLLLVVSETGLVYTFTTPKLQPLVTKPEGKNLIQSCLNAPDPTDPIPTQPQGTRLSTTNDSNASTSPQTANYYRPNQALDMSDKKRFGNVIPTNPSMVLNTTTTPKSQIPQNYSSMSSYSTYVSSNPEDTIQSTISGGAPMYGYSMQPNSNDGRYWEISTDNKRQQGISKR